MKLRPKVHHLNLEDPERAVDDPGLAALARDGWTVAGSLLVARREPQGEVQRLMLILWPPAESARPRLLAPAIVVSLLAGQALGIVGTLAGVWALGVLS